MPNTLESTSAPTPFNFVAYGDLLQKTTPARVETEVEYRRMLATADSLMDRHESLTPEEAKLLRLLGLLLQDYEQRRYRLGLNLSSADLLRHLLEERDLRPKDLWPVLGSKGLASEILSGKRAVSKAKARDLAAFFHVPADVFLR